MSSWTPYFRMIENPACVYFQKEQWIFHDTSGPAGKQFDEELYVSGKTVVWSRGGQDGAKVVVTTYTVDTPVLQVTIFYCPFVIYTLYIHLTVDTPVLQVTISYCPFVIYTLYIHLIVDTPVLQVTISYCPFVIYTLYVYTPDC